MTGTAGQRGPGSLFMELQVLDTTIRDGSNAIGFGYTEEDLTVVIAGLTSNAVSWIEVGHGVSIGLSPDQFPPATVPDQRTFELARELANGAQVGAVLVPALASPAVLDTALDHLDFIRLAPGPGMLDGCLPYVEAIRARGKKVFLQLVKTHTYRPDTLVERVRPLVDQGLFGVFVVDTAGCMTPADVGRYVSLLRDAFEVPIGFHGHNNACLAVTNSMAAVDAGASFVDATLGGIGRGAGNAQLEVLIWLMQASGRCEGISAERLFDLSHYLWRRFPQASRGVDPVEAYYAMQGWDALSKESALATAADLAMSPFTFIRSVAQRATGPWITDQDVRETARLLGRAEG